METGVVRFLSKTNLLLEKFFLGNCQIQEELIETFLAVLWQQEKTEVESALVVLPVLTEWIKSSVAAWSSTGKNVHLNIVSFSLNIASLLSKDEETFCALNNNNFYIKLINLSKARQVEVAPSVKRNYIKLLSSLLEHKSGIELMIACNFWEDVLQLSLSEQSDEIIAESTHFMAKLLQEIVDYDEMFCNNVVIRIMLSDNIYRCLNAATDVNTADEVTEQYLLPTLKLVGNVMDHFFQRILLEQEDFKVVLLFYKNFRLDERMCELIMAMNSTHLVFHYGKIMFNMKFLELYLQCSGAATSTQIEATVEKIRRNFMLSISKGKFEDVIEFCNFGQIYWNLMDAKIPRSQSKNEQKSIASQLMVLLLLPNLVLVANHCLPKEQVLELFREEFRDSFMYKITKITCQDVIRACFSWRRILIQFGPGVYELATRSLTHVKNARKYFSTDEAVVVFQSYIYSSKDFLHATKQSPKKVNSMDNDLYYFAKVLELLALLIEEFHITWKESFEAIDVMVISFDFLSLPRWSTDIVVRALKLINIAIAKYMLPNMALLVDRTEDSVINFLGPVLYSKLYDEEAEVKKATLEVICTIAHMAYSRK